MNLKKIFNKNSPFFHVIISNNKNHTKIKNEFQSQLIKNNIKLIQLNGEKMETKSELFEEFKKGFIFPEYFSKNWDSFEELINDLNWLKNKGYILLIFSASKLLIKDSSIEKEIFYDILIKAIDEWNSKKNILFHIVFEVDSSSFIDFEKNNKFLFNNVVVDTLESDR